MNGQTVENDLREAIWHYRTGQLRTADNLCRRVLAADPKHTKAMQLLGVIAGQCGQHKNALDWTRQAVRLQPSSAELQHNLGAALATVGEVEPAMAAFQRAAELDPKIAEPYVGMGNILRDFDQFEAAIDAFQRGLHIRPSCVEAHNGLGTVLVQQGRILEAIQRFRFALRYQPRYAPAHANLAMALLSIGEFEQGWAEHEWRWQQGHASSMRRWAKPRWKGEDPTGRTVLLHAEGGLGDTIQFVRYGLLLAQRGARIIVECQPLLKPLFTQSFKTSIATIAFGERLPEHDLQAALMSLPGIMGTTLLTIPAEVPYLQADGILVDRWRGELSNINGFKVGIAWQGNPNYPDDRRRSLPLKHFQRIAQIPNVRLLSLQKNAGAEQVQKLANAFSLMDLGPRLDCAAGAFMDTAAVMKCLDLVITSDTAIAHLAGALGIPVWMALSFTPDWRWMRDREDSPWYPTMRLFRQKHFGDWDGVFHRIAESLGAEAARVPQ